MRKIIWAGITMVLAGVVIVSIWVKIEMVKMAYSLEHLEAQKAVLQQEADQLRLRLSRLMSPESIARQASTRLGLRSPKPGEVRLIPFLVTEESALSSTNETMVSLNQLQVAKTAGDQE